MRLLRVLVLALCQYSLTRQALLHEEKTNNQVFEIGKYFLLENEKFSLIVEIQMEGHPKPPVKSTNAIRYTYS